MRLLSSITQRIFRIYSGVFIVSVFKQNYNDLSLCYWICETPHCACIWTVQTQDNSQYLSMVEAVLNSDGHYFSASFDLTHTLQRLANTSPDFKNLPLHERVAYHFCTSAVLFSLGKSRDILTIFASQINEIMLNLFFCELSGTLIILKKNVTLKLWVTLSLVVNLLQRQNCFFSFVMRSKGYPWCKKNWCSFLKYLPTTKSEG